MGISAGSEIIIARIHNVGALALGVIHLHGFLVDMHGHGFVGTGLDGIGLGIAYQFDGGLFNTILLVVVGVRRLHVDLHYVLAGNLADVRYLHRHVVTAIGLLHREVRPLEIGVAQAIAERILHLRGVIVVGLVFIAEHHVFVTGFVITVANVNAFSVNHIASAEALFAVGDAVGTKIGGRRCGSQIISIRVRQVAGRIHRAIEHVGNTCGAGLSERADPQRGINVFAFKIGKFHRILRIEQHHNLIEIVSGHLDHGTLVIIELQIRVAGLQLGGRQILTFAAGTADHHNRRVIVLGE